MSIEAYGKHPLQSIKVFHFEKLNGPTIVFIHGGAWRDVNNTYDDFEVMSDTITKQGTRVNLIGINYRLSPEFKHPTHLVDILLALQYIVLNYSGNVNLVGHSVGATLILQLLNFEEFINQYDDLITPELQKAIVIVKQVVLRNLFLVDGIYDMVQLVKEYPGYSLFVEDAFENVLDYTGASQLSNNKVDLKSSPFPFAKIYVLQSVQDELLSLHQTNLLVNYFQSHNVKYELITDKWGKHEQVYKNEKVIQLIIDKFA